jgi:hypothetical protein
VLNACPRGPQAPRRTVDRTAPRVPRHPAEVDREAWRWATPTDASNRYRDDPDARAQGGPSRPRPHVVIDECHHVPAVQVEPCSRPSQPAMSRASRQHRTGAMVINRSSRCSADLSATSRAGRRFAQERLWSVGVIRKDTSFHPSVLPSQASIQEIYGALANDIDRLSLVLADIRELVREDRALVVLTERREHLDRIANSVRGEIPNLVVLHGGIKPKARRAAMTQLAEQPDHEPRLILATGRYLGEGFDEPRLDTLLLTMPIAWKGTVVRYAGRLHRAHAAKRDIPDLRLRRLRGAGAPAHVRQAPPHLLRDGLRLRRVGARTHPVARDAWLGVVSQSTERVVRVLRSLAAAARVSAARHRCSGFGPKIAGL